ncbi:MAG: [FeFe] hydrogenase H-cluster radical SAM maturase HydG [Peptococcaceae bacterium]|nr:[FeFe] hydrogenase H-cluster radical SAM maturase HydG [Peptococcaceae bacterium]
MTMDASQIRATLQKARECHGLSTSEADALLSLPEEWDAELFARAREVKDKIYGKRVVLFAPLYISNYCSNSCLYCSFRMENSALKRVHLTQDEIRAEAEHLIKMGHKRVLLETGEDDASTLTYVLKAINTIYGASVDGHSIRRINVNIAATSTENYRLLKRANIGTYQLFQETYHEPTYRQMHPAGPKSDYLYHLGAMERALDGGLDDYGLGVLFGLYDYRYEVRALLDHAEHLKKSKGIGPHTISVPRLRPAKGADYPLNHLLTDAQFARVVAILRLAVPYTGIILSTRESPTMRDFLLDVGVSQISAASVTTPGGYAGTGDADAGQFTGADHRSLNECVDSIISRGYVPSFCTGCYRHQRTGSEFMHLAEKGHIKEFCQVNAILTLAEFVAAFGAESTRLAANGQWEAWLRQIPDPKLREQTRLDLAAVVMGERDKYV